MKVRPDIVFISSVLFTIALLWSLPGPLAGAWTWRRSMFQQTDQLWLSNYLAPIGFASLAIISIGLIVTWSGFINRVRWAWFVMAIIVMIWAFPTMVLPLLQHTIVPMPLTQWLRSALTEPGPSQAILIFSLLVLALILPINSFFHLSRSERKNQ